MLTSHLRILVTITVLMLFTGCAGTEKNPMADNTSEALTGTSWLAEDIGGRGVIDYAQTTISFDADGRVSGSGGCNRYFGPVTMGENTIAFGVLGSTRRACPPALMDQEQKFFGALAVTRSYRFDEPGHKLVFLGDNGEPLMRFSQITP
ncbi:MAG: META domain-containing protein [Hyphomicrobiales bacterium]|nr:META domain-containing protein [Hyphomicrobiales bacterium]